jgi:hypothetical protein
MNAEFRDISKEAFIIAYKENFGNITIACESAGVGRGQYKAWCDKDPEFRQRLAEIEPEEIMLDFGEHKLMERIAKGDTLATMFLLKTKGKRRGYIERQEVAHEGDVVKQITVNVLKASHVEELSNGAQQLDGDENRSEGYDNLLVEDSGMVVPATEAANIQDIPLYEFDKEVELPNEMDIYEE